MSILLLVVVLLVVAIVLSRLTWASQLGERRSIKHHEQAMDVLRSVAGSPTGPEHGEDELSTGAAHVRSPAGEGGALPPPVGARAVPEGSGPPEETIRILRATPADAERPGSMPGAAAARLPDPPAAPPPPPPTFPGGAEPTPPPATDAPEPVTAGPAEAQGVEARQSDPAAPPAAEGEQVKPAFVFQADGGRAAGAMAPPGADDHGERADAGQPTPGGGWGDGRRWGDEDAGLSELPSPPSIGDQEWPPSTRSAARSRTRARTRSQLWAGLLVPVVAVRRTASEAVARLRSGRLPRPNGGEGPDDLDLWRAPPGPAVGPPRVTAPDGTGGAVATKVADTTVAPAVTDDFDVPAGMGASAEAGRTVRPAWTTAASWRSRLGVAAGLAAAVIACIVIILVVALSSSGSNTSQTKQAAPPPASTAPAPAPPPPAAVRLVSSDQQGAVYHVTSNHVVLSAVASGRVWLEAAAWAGVNGGPVLYQGILTSGQSQTITHDGPVWLRIGAVGNVAVNVNGTGVVLPPGGSTTYNLTFTQF